MRLPKIMGLLLLTAFMSQGGPALSGSAPPSWNQVDANHDGKVTKEELAPYIKDKARLERGYKALDVDRDGVLTEKDARIIYRQMDKNKDGKVSRKEYEDYYQRWQKGLEAPVNDRAPRKSDFKELDHNRDGYADYDEHFSRWPVLWPYWR